MLRRVNLLQIARARSYSAEPLKFYGNTNISQSDEERMKSVFGGRLANGARESSSRLEADKPRVICGVLVPAKPKEPHNCCMSGCVNCVWEQYNDDFREWRLLRKEAAKRINETDEQWPADFNPPLQLLHMKNVPVELRKTKLKMGNKKRLSSASYFPPSGATIAKPAKPAVDQPEEEDDDAWNNVPVSFKVFAETERRMKLKKQQRQQAQQAQQAQQNEQAQQNQ